MASTTLGFCSVLAHTGEPVVGTFSTQTSSPLFISFRLGRTAPPPLVLCTVSKPRIEATPEEGKTKRQPRGITKPRPISPVMQELLGVAEIPRTQALKQIWAYIKQHNLQDPQDKKVIVCDEKLKRVFAGRERVGFLEIAGLIGPHFMK